jgi:peptidoglycan/xylan/chitin deacetylase (PgdA/CDA1 family)
VKISLRKASFILIIVPAFAVWANPAQLTVGHEGDLTFRGTGMTMRISTPHKEPDPLKLLRPDFNSEALGATTVESSTKRKAPQSGQKNLPVTANASEHFAQIPQSGEKELYLTFDDGPLEGTANVLRILREEGVPATMFCVGRHARKHPGLFHKELTMPNLLIANHTYSHANGHYSRFYSHTFELLSDIEHAQIILGGRKYLRLAGRNVWRTPEVHRDDQAIVAVRGRVEVPKYNRISEEGFFIYGWDTEWHYDHATGRPLENPDLLAAKIESLYSHRRLVKPGKVVLLAHDFMFRTVAEASRLRRFIRLMKQRGWIFRTIRYYSRYVPEPLRVAKYYGHRPHDRLAANALLSPRTGRAERPVHVSRSDMAPVPTSSSTPIQNRLNEAIRRYDAKEVEQLIKHGALLNRPDTHGQTALDAAVRANSLYLVKKLLAYGADPGMRNSRGETAFHVARRFKREGIERYLLHYSKLRSQSITDGKQSTPETRHLADSTPVSHRDPLKFLRQH